MQQNIHVQLFTYLRGWTHDLRVIAGDTSSYLRGDDTSKLVTPSEACWTETNESHKQRTDTVWSEAYLSACLYSSYYVHRWRRSVESVERDAVVHRDVTQARPPARNAQLNYPPWLEEKENTRKLFYHNVTVTYIDDLIWNDLKALIHGIKQRTMGENWPF